MGSLGPTEGETIHCWCLRTILGFLDVVTGNSRVKCAKKNGYLHRSIYQSFFLPCLLACFALLCLALPSFFIYFFLSIFLPFYLLVFLSFYLLIFEYSYLPAFLSFYRYIRPSFYRSIVLSILSSLVESNPVCSNLPFCLVCLPIQCIPRPKTF